MTLEENLADLRRFHRAHNGLVELAALARQHLLEPLAAHVKMTNVPYKGANPAMTS